MINRSNYYHDYYQIPLIILIIIASVYLMLHPDKLSGLTPEKLESIIITGRTTKQEILRVFGKPKVQDKYTPQIDMFGFDQNITEVWKYSSHRGIAETFFSFLPFLNQLAGYSLHKRGLDLIISFNKKGIVVGYRCTNY